MKKETSNNDLAITVGIISSKVDRIGEDIKEIKAKLEHDVATKEWVNAEYSGARSAINRVTWIIVSAVILAVISLVLKK